MTVPFLTYAFPATGGSANRTMPDRLHDVVNVLDYGADPTETTDSTAAINAAITAAGASGYGGHLNATGGVVYFPPGDYKVNGTLSSPRTSGLKRSVRLLGAGKTATTLRGTNNTWYLIATVADFDEIIGIENMSVINLSTVPGTGAAALLYLGSALVRNCLFSGMYGLRIDNNTFNSSVEECNFVGPSVYSASSVGLTIGQNAVYNCTISGFGTGMTVYNGGATIVGTRVFNCGDGIIIGSDSNLSLISLVAFSIKSTVIDSCNRGLVMQSARSGFVAGL